jgi:hypothetical protein
LADGGFGQVYQVEIHPDHHNFPSSGVRILIVPSNHRLC